MRPVERAAGGRIARAVVLENGAIAIFDIDGAVLRQQLLHPAVERDLGGRKCLVAARSPARPAGDAPSRRARPRPRPQARRSRVRRRRANAGRAAGLPSSRLRERSARSSAATRPECSASTASTSRSRKRRRSDAARMNSRSIAGVSQTTRRWSAKAAAELTGLAVDPALAGRRSLLGRGRLDARCRAWRGPACLRVSAETAQEPSPSENATSSNVARRKPRPGASNEIASIRLVLPAPLAPVSTTRLGVDIEACAAR